MIFLKILKENQEKSNWIGMKRHLNEQEEREELEEQDEECSAKLRGACDCKRCLELIIRNANNLLRHGWHIYYCDNGPGGFGFNVSSSREVVRILVDGEINIHDSIVRKPLSVLDIEKMCREVVPLAWTGQSTYEELVQDWRPFFHLLKQKKKIKLIKK